MIAASSNQPPATCSGFATSCDRPHSRQCSHAELSRRRPQGSCTNTRPASAIFSRLARGNQHLDVARRHPCLPRHHGSGSGPSATSTITASRFGLARIEASPCANSGPNSSGDRPGARLRACEHSAAAPLPRLRSDRKYGSADGRCRPGEAIASSRWRNRVSHDGITWDVARVIPDFSLFPPSTKAMVASSQSGRPA